MALLCHQNSESSRDGLREAPPNHHESVHRPLVLSAAQSPAAEVPGPSKMFNPPASSLTAQNCLSQLPTLSLHRGQADNILLPLMIYASNRHAVLSHLATTSPEFYIILWSVSP